MDDLEGRAGPAAGHRWVSQLGQVGTRAPLPDRQLHAGGVARRRSIQEGDPDRQPELLAADPGRGRRARDAGEEAPAKAITAVCRASNCSLSSSRRNSIFPFFACLPEDKQTIDNRNLRQNNFLQ